MLAENNNFNAFFRDYFLLHTLQRIEESLTKLHKKVDRVMAKETEVEQLISEIDDATNRVADRVSALILEVTDLKQIIANGGTVTQAQLDAIALALTNERDRLITLGQNPTNPIPAGA